MVAVWLKMITFDRFFKEYDKIEAYLVAVVRFICVVGDFCSTGRHYGNKLFGISGIGARGCVGRA
jgi:hypothetical protein